MIRPNRTPAEQPPARQHSKTLPTPDAVAAQGSGDQLALIERIETILREETEALRQSDTSILARSMERKAQALVELNRAVASSREFFVTPPARARLTALRRALAANEAALKVQMRALEELVSIFTSSLLDAESDGTYLPYTKKMRTAR